MTTHTSDGTDRARMTPIRCAVLSQPLTLKPVPGVPQRVLLGKSIWENALITLHSDGHLLIEFAADDLDELELDLSILEVESGSTDAATSRPGVGIGGADDDVGGRRLHLEEGHR